MSSIYHVIVPADETKPTQTSDTRAVFLKEGILDKVQADGGDVSISRSFGAVGTPTILVLTLPDGKEPGNYLTGFAFDRVIPEQPFSSQSQQSGGEGSQRGEP